VSPRPASVRRRRLSASECRQREITQQLSEEEWERRGKIPRSRTSWGQVELEEFWDGEGIPPPEYLRRFDDDVPLIYPAKLHTIHGEPEAGKGWLAHRVAHELIDARKHVLYIDFEDDPMSAVERQKVLGTGRKESLNCLHYVQPAEPLSSGHEDLEHLLDAFPIKLAIFDGLTEGYTLNGLDPSNNGDAAKWFQLLPRPLTKKGIAVLQIDHVVKDGDSRGRWAIGGQHKLAGVDTAYSLQSVQPFGREHDGLARLYVVKDRPGWVQRHAVGRDRQVADVHLSSSPNGEVSVDLLAPDTQGCNDSRLVGSMERMRKAIENDPGLSTRAVLSSTGGNQRRKIEALARLVDEGFVRVEAEGKTKKHYPVEAPK
jgi:hypothetical protein